jgi:hypothetical protein
MVAETLRAAGAEAVVTTRYTFGTAARIVARKPTTEAKK